MSGAFPRVSFVTATFNRYPQWGWLLEEVAECIRQNAADYPGEVEWLLCNDAPGQELTCELPGVRVNVMNVPTRYPSLSAKLNAAIGAATGEIILCQDDDDLSLPHRARQAQERLSAEWTWSFDKQDWLVREIEIFNPQATWYWEPTGGLHSDHTHGVCFNAAAFRKSAWAAVGGYPEHADNPEMRSGAQDQWLDGALKRRGRVARHLSPREPETWSYVYRFGVQPHHLSGRYPHSPFYAAHGDQAVTPGRFAIVPRWREDYLGMVAHHLSRRAAPL